MYAPVKEIMTDLLKYDLSSDEALLVLCITREDIRMLTSEWPLSEDVMSGLNLASTTKEDQDRVAIDLVASGVAYKERLAMPVVAELVARDVPEHLREYFRERLEHYRQVSAQLPDKNAPEYARKEDEVKK